MEKYVVKNCPAYNEGKCLYDYCLGKPNREDKCEDVVYCVIKHVIEKCKEPNEPYYNSECEYGIGRIDLGKEILELFEIEEK